MRMKTFTKAVALFVVMALMMVMTISAATVTDIEVTLQPDNKSVVITAAHPDGAAADGKLVNVVVNNGTADVYWNDAVVENGKVSFTFEMDPATDATGTYNVEMGGQGLELNPANDAATGDTFTFVNEADAVTFITKVNPYDAATLRTYLEGNADDFDGDGVDATQFDVNCVDPGSDYSLISGTSKEMVMDILAAIEFDDHPNEDIAGDFSQADYYNFLAKFNQAVTISLLNDNAATNVVAKYKNVFVFDTTTWYGRITTDEQRQAVEAALLGKDFDRDNGAEVVDAFNKATILALFNEMNQTTKGNLAEYIAYTNEAEDLGHNKFTAMDLDSYETLAGIKGGYYADMVRDAMAIETYESLEDVEEVFADELEKAWDAYEKTVNDGPSGPVVPDGPSSSIIVTPVTPAKDLFNDLGGVEWAKEAINALAEDGIVNGVAEGKFAPNDVLTREQFVKILVGALDIKASGNTPFTDVITSEWYANFVAIAYNSGIVNGTSATEFGVGQSLTREQLCTMVYRAIKALGIELKMVNNAAAFADGAEISDWAKEAVDYLYRAGVVNGVGGNAFDPQGTTTRAMGAKVIYGVLEGGVK